ncbi:hypothetical protein J1N35_018867, partial [Gossypium stocksii]
SVDEGIEPKNFEVEEEALNTFVEHEGLEVDFQEEILFEELSEELSIIKEISDESIEEPPYFLDVLEETP